MKRLLLLLLLSPSVALGGTWDAVYPEPTPASTDHVLIEDDPTGTPATSVVEIGAAVKAGQASIDALGTVNSATSITSSAFVGPLTGNADTATALAANGGNCSAGSYPLGVDASGAVETCTDATTEIDSAISTHNAITSSTTVSGHLEVATGAETNTGTSAVLAVSPDALDDWTGSAQVTTLGTIATGVWNGTDIADADVANDLTINSTSAITSTSSVGGYWFKANGNGGITGSINLYEAPNNGTDYVSFFPSTAMTAPYSLIFPDAQGGSGEVLTNNGSGTLSWSANGSGDVTKTGTMVDTYIAYWLTDGSISGEAGFTYDDSTNTLTVPTLTATNLNAGTSGTVDLTASAGVLTILGAHTGADEDWTIDLDGTANTVVHGTSTGVTAHSFGSLNLVTSGTINGNVEVTADTTATVTTFTCDGEMRINSDNDVIDYTLPGAASGLSCCFYSQFAQVVTIDVADGVDTITLDGTALTAGNAIDSPGTAGDFICLLAIDATNWLSLGKSGTWVDGGTD